MSQGAFAVEIVSAQSSGLVQAIKNHISIMTPWKGAEIEIRSIGNLNGVDLPAGELTFHVHQKNPPATLRGLVLSIQAELDGKPVRTFWVSANITIRAPSVRATRRIPFGSVVTADDIREEMAEIKDLRDEPIRKAEDAIGKVLRRSLSPGDPLTRESVTAPFLVRSGEKVRLRLDRGPVSLSVQAQAEQNGRLGDKIRVRNQDFSRPVSAQVTGPGEVRVHSNYP